MRYRSKPVEVEAMQWVGWPHVSYRDGEANKIVAWVNANGGEARYERGGTYGENSLLTLPHIAVRTINGWAYAEPGHYVVMGEATFVVSVPPVGGKRLRDFYPCDPETFEKRWEPLS